MLDFFRGTGKWHKPYYDKPIEIERPPPLQSPRQEPLVDNKNIRLPPKKGDKEWDPSIIYGINDDYSKLTEQDIIDYYNLLPRLREILNDYLISDYMFMYEINYFLQRRNYKSVGAMMYLLGIFYIGLFSQDLVIYHDRLENMLGVSINKMKNGLLANIGYEPNTDPYNIKQANLLIDSLHKSLKIHPKLIEKYKNDNSFSYYIIQNDVSYKTNFMVSPFRFITLTFYHQYQPIKDDNHYKDKIVLDTLLNNERFKIHDEDQQLKFIITSITEQFNKTFIPYLKPHLLFNLKNGKQPLYKDEMQKIEESLTFLYTYLIPNFENNWFVLINFYIAIWYRCILNRIDSYPAICHYMGLSYFVWNNTIAINENIFCKRWMNIDFTSLNENKPLRYLFRAMNIVYVDPDENSINKWKETMCGLIDDRTIKGWHFIQIPPYYFHSHYLIDMVYLWRQHLNVGEQIWNYEYEDETFGINVRLLVIDESHIQHDNGLEYIPTQIIFQNPKTNRKSKIIHNHITSDNLIVDGITYSQKMTLNHWLEKRKINNFDDLVNKYWNLDEAMIEFKGEEYPNSEIDLEKCKEYLIKKWELLEVEIKNKSKVKPKNEVKAKSEVDEEKEKRPFKFNSLIIRPDGNKHNGEFRPIKTQLELFEDEYYSEKNDEYYYSYTYYSEDEPPNHHHNQSSNQRQSQRLSSQRVSQSTSAIRPPPQQLSSNQQSNQQSSNQQQKPKPKPKKKRRPRRLH
jgi:hypothetical protein